jgi:hypothetical protein
MARRLRESDIKTRGRREVRQFPFVEKLGTARLSPYFPHHIFPGLKPAPDSNGPPRQTIFKPQPNLSHCRDQCLLEG